MHKLFNITFKIRSNKSSANCVECGVIETRECEQHAITRSLDSIRHNIRDSLCDVINHSSRQWIQRIQWVTRPRRGRSRWKGGMEQDGRGDVSTRTTSGPGHLFVWRKDECYATEVTGGLQRAIVINNCKNDDS